MAHSSESLESKCEWSGPLPAFKERAECLACKLHLTAGEIIRCQVRGTQAPQVAIKPSRPKALTKPEVKQPSRPRRPQVHSGIGDCLKLYFDSIGAEQGEGCSCEDIRLQLNKRTSDQVMVELDNWVASVMSNVKYLKGVKGLAIKAASRLLPKTMQTEVKSVILRCMEESNAKLSIIAQDASRIDPDQNTTTAS